MQVRHGQLPAGVLTVAAAVVLLVCFPPIHIHPLAVSSSKDAADPALLGARATADAFWTQTLLTAPALDIKTLLALMQAQPAAAALRGHSADVGGTPAYLLSGRGRVVARDEDGLWLDVGASTPIRVLLLTGPIFGNALRDATGTLPMGRMSFTRFNTISDELNHLSETRGRQSLPARVPVGTNMEFRAAGQIDNSGSSPVLELAPIKVRLL